MQVSKGFQVFAKEAPEVQNAWMDFVQSLRSSSSLDKKTEALAYLSVLSAIRLHGGLPLHVQMAKSFGATKEEIISAILVGIPAVGHVVTEALPIAIEAFEQS